MGLKFDGLETVKLQRESYRFRVRVVRKWFVPDFMNSEQPMSMELILMDDSGNRIQATVRKSVLYKFSENIKEGVVYRMSYFGVVHNTGSYRATTHEFKLVFQLRTTISEYSCDTIPFFGIVPVAFDVVNSLNGEHDYLIDVVGMMTDVSAQREYLRDGKVTRMIVLELTDPVGKIDCTLFGDYVDQVISFLHDFRSFPPMIVLQYAKVKIFKEKEGSIGGICCCHRCS